MKVAVIGAGAAGLVALRELTMAGHTVTAFEKSGEVGGIWRYTEATDDDLSGRAPGTSVWSSVYASLRTNLPRDIMAYLDYTFDSSGGGRDDWPRFPPHENVQTYLLNFAADFKLLPNIRFRTEVIAIAPEDSRWLIRSRGAQTRDEVFDAVAVCNGHYAKPRVPPLPGIDAFEGKVWHSHNYRRPEPFAGRRVAVWGTSASGADISLELSMVADVVWCGNAFADMEPGRRIRDTRAYPSPVAISPDGRLEFAGGRSAPPVDDFLFCTGYEYSFPFLDEAIVAVDDNRVHPLFQQIIPPAYPTLAFIGIPFLIVPFPLFEMQAKWFAAMLEGRVALPDEQAMRDQTDQDYEKKRAAGWLNRHMHKLGDAQTDYYNLLAAQCGEPPLPDWFGQIASAAQQARFDDPSGFRDRPFPAPGPTKVL